MRDLAFFFGRKLQQLCSFYHTCRSNFRFLISRLCVFFHICRSNFCFLISQLGEFFRACRSSFCSATSSLHLSPLFYQLSYLTSVSLLGFLALRSFSPRTDHPTPYRPRDLDLLFTAASAATLSSMSAVEMEVFSNAQLLVLTLVIFLGGDVFTSMVGLPFRASKLKKQWKIPKKVHPSASNSLTANHRCIELDLIVVTPTIDPACNDSEPELVQTDSHLEHLDHLMSKSMKFLGVVVSSYLVVAHALGISSVLVYVAVVASAKRVLADKGLNALTFSVFTAVSTFTNCGFIPTNENMMAFAHNSGLLLLLIPQVLLGNTLFAPCLRFSLWFLRRVMKSEEEARCSEFLLENARGAGFHALLPRRDSRFLAATVLSLILVQFAALCAMDWDSEALNGLSAYEKIVGAVFLCVNTRHSGESSVDISLLSPAILVLFIIMMYLPSSTCFMPRKGMEEERPLMHEVEDQKPKSWQGKVVESIMLSPLSCVATFIVLICITERKKMKEDPINFSTLNIVFETISAYGSVGLTTGYSCSRRLKHDGFCENKWYGFAGRWSDEGKMILVAVMFSGRLEKFFMNRSKA